MAVIIILIIMAILLGIALYDIGIINSNQKLIMSSLNTINNNLMELDKTFKNSQLGLSSQIKEVNSLIKSNGSAINKIANKTGAW